MLLVAALPVTLEDHASQPGRPVDSDDNVSQVDGLSTQLPTKQIVDTVSHLWYYVISLSEGDC
jgi:hypothetical protein